MSSFTVLESALSEILSVIQPTTEDREARRRIIDEFRAVVQSSGNFIDKFEKLNYIGRARVPILKFESRHQGISCDISINNFKGVIKSKIFAWINEIDGRFRQLVLLVKEWAIAHEINNSRDGTFNSYALSLLVIFHFQTCVPPILPPLKELYFGNISDDIAGRGDAVKRQIQESFSSNIARFKSKQSGFINHSSLADLFVSFLEKFSDIHLKACGKVICPYTGQWEHNNFNRWFSASVIFLEDPFEQPENAARSVRYIGVINEHFEAHTVDFPLSILPEKRQSRL